MSGPIDPVRLCPACQTVMEGQFLNGVGWRLWCPECPPVVEAEKVSVAAMPSADGREIIMFIGGLRVALVTEEARRIEGALHGALALRDQAAFDGARDAGEGASHEGRKAGRTLNTQEEYELLPKLDISKPIYVEGRLVHWLATDSYGLHELSHGDTYPRSDTYRPNGARWLAPLNHQPASNYPEAMCAADVIRLHAAATSLCAFAPSREPTENDPTDSTQGGAA